MLQLKSQTHRKNKEGSSIISDPIKDIILREEINQ